MKMKNRTSYRFKVYFLVRNIDVINKFKEKFRTTVNVNYVADIETDEEGRRLLLESERRGFLKIRDYENRN